MMPQEGHTQRRLLLFLVVVVAGGVRPRLLGWWIASPSEGNVCYSAGGALFLHGCREARGRRCLHPSPPSLDFFLQTVGFCGIINFDKV